MLWKILPEEETSTPVEDSIAEEVEEEEVVDEEEEEGAEADESEDEEDAVEEGRGEEVEEDLEEKEAEEEKAAGTFILGMAVSTLGESVNDMRAISTLASNALPQKSVLSI